MSSKVVIMGAGGHGKVVADMTMRSGDVVVGFLDDGLEKGTTILGLPVLGAISDCHEYESDCQFIIAMGSGELREKISNAHKGLRWYTACHPTAVTGLECGIGEGSSLGAFSVVNPGSEVGRHCIVNTAAIVEHDCRIGDFCHIAPKACIGGFVTVGRHVWVGLGCSIRNVLTICDHVTLGAGCTVVKDITEPGVYVGTPARKFR